MSARRLLLVAAIVIGALLALPAAAVAHAGLVSSTPEPGAELGTAPGAVILRFSEPLNPRLSGASLTTPDGARVEGRVLGSEEISVQLLANARGVYRVSWTSVSLLDGHTFSGSFEFGVGVPASSRASGGISTAPRRIDLLISLARAVEDAGLLLAGGFLLLSALGRRKPALGWVRAHPVVPLAFAFGGGMAVVSSEAITAAHGFSPGAIVSYLTTGLSGVSRLIRPPLELLALSLAWRRSRHTAWLVAGSVAALAAAGHAAATSPKLWGVTLEAVHVGAAIVWAGGILSFALQRPPDGWSGVQGRTLLGRFTPVALGAFIVTAVAGVLRGVQEVGSLHEMFASSYGVTLLVKSLLVVLMVPLSVLAWRRLLVAPRLESMLAIGVVVAAALLAAYPLPPARLSGAEKAVSEAADPGLPQVGDLTLGGRAGTTLVGLTLSPGRPGRNDALVYVLPLAGELAPSLVKVAMAIDGRRVGLHLCGRTCRRTALDLTGGERIEVQVGGTETGVVFFDVPHLPAPDGRKLFAELEQRMHTLTSYRLYESLSSGSSTIRTSYASRAPDEMRSRSTGGFQTVWLGRTEYLKRQLGGGWIVESGGAPYSVLSFVWDYVPDRIVDPRIVGQARVDGVATTILSFYGPISSAAYWFRLWVDSTGLVRRVEMRAQGHFMNQRYFAFNAPIQITAPIAAGG